MPRPSGPPNVLLFLTDDHAAWALGQRTAELQTPVLTRLALTGSRFAHAFTPSPVCSPARACLLTGRTPSQVGIHDWLMEEHPQVAGHDWLAGEPTLADVFHSAGYTCGLAGKWHLGQSHRRPAGFDWAFTLSPSQGRHFGPYTYFDNGRAINSDGNKTQIITDAALRFLEQAPFDQPFFLNVGFIETHSPYADHEPALIDAYSAATFADVPAPPPHPWRKNEDFADGLTATDRRRRLAGYYAAVTNIDRHVGRVLNHLEQTDRLDNTIVVYVSDHGCCLGHHGFWGKGNSTRPLNMYDTSIRVPLIWRLPESLGGRAGLIHQQCVDHYDTYQTIRDLIGRPPGAAERAERRFPGRSYAPALRGEALTDWDDTRFGEYGDLRMIRTPHAKLVRRYPDGPDDLFDLPADPQEQCNLIADPRWAARRSELEHRLNAFYAVHEDPSRSGLRVKQLPVHNIGHEAWRDGRREARGLQVYP